MPFNGSGTFTIVNTFVPNTTILSAAVNQNFSDIATGLSDCLTRDGQAGMTAVFKAISGSIGAPGISFNSDATAGLYLSTTGIVGLVAKSLGLLVNSSIYQVSSVAVQSGGSGYAVGDTITLTGGTAVIQAVLTVATLSGSAVATATVTYGGFYSVKPSDPVAQGSTSGSGSSATFNITWSTQFLKSLITDESGALPWQRLGASSFVSGIMAKANGYDFSKSIMTFGSGVSLSNSTSPPTLTATLNPTLVPNYLSGLTMSTAGSSSTMTIAAGVANDSTNSTLMNLSSAISKTTASWAVGTGNGGIDTGSIANSTWYHFYEIERTDTGVVDIIFSLSSSSPALPTNYTIYRRIGSGKTDTSAHWVLFTQRGNSFMLSTPVLDVTSSNNPGTSAISVTLASVPSGIVVEADYNFMMLAATTGSMFYYISALTEADLAPATTGSAGTNPLATGMGLPTIAGVPIRNRTFTNTSQAFRVRLSASGASDAYRISTLGWIDLRGTLG